MQYIPFSKRNIDLLSQPSTRFRLPKIRILIVYNYVFCTHFKSHFLIQQRFLLPYNYKLWGVLPCQTPPPSFQDAFWERLRTLPSWASPTSIPVSYTLFCQRDLSIVDGFFCFCYRRNSELFQDDKNGKRQEQSE